MPSFPRLGKHSNRSQNALAEPHAAITTIAGGGIGGTAPDTAPQLQVSAQSQHSDPPLQLQAHSFPQGQAQQQDQGLSLTTVQDHRVQQQAQQQQNPHVQHSQRHSHQVESSAYANSPGSAKLSPSSEPPVVNARAGQQSKSLPGQHQEVHQPLSARTTGGGVVIPPHSQQNHFYSSQDQTSVEPAVAEDRWRPDSSDATVNRAQSQRYSTYATIPHREHHYPQQEQHQLEHQQTYSLVSSSLDDLPSTAAAGYTGTVQQHPPPQLQSPPAPEKKSRRKLIKGIFSSSSRHENHNQHHNYQQSQQGHSQHQGSNHSHQGSYDNTIGLARRPSKRASNPPPALNTRLSGQGQYYQDSNWQSQDPYSHETSPQGGIETSHYQLSRIDRDREDTSSEPQISHSGTIRQVSAEIDSPYDEASIFRHQQQLQAAQQSQHLPPQPHHGQQHSGQGLAHHQSAPPLQPHVQLHLEQDQVHHYKQQHPQQAPVAYEQQPVEDIDHISGKDQSYVSPALAQQIGDLRSFAQPRNPETVSQASYESPVADSEQRSATEYPAQAPTATGYSGHTAEFGSSPGQTVAEPSVTPGQHQLIMPQASTVNPSSRRAQEAEKMSTRGQGEGSAAAAPGYRHSNTSAGALAPVAPVTGQGASPSPAFRGDSTPRFEPATLEQGRHSPQPNTVERDAQNEDKAFKDLRTEHPLCPSLML